MDARHLRSQRQWPVANAQRLQHHYFQTLVSDADALRAGPGMEKIVLMGHSYGVFLAMEYALRYQENFSGLILASTLPNITNYAPIIVSTRLSEITEPTLIPGGRNDFIMIPQGHIDLDAALPNSKLVFFENSGHFPFITEADLYRQTVSDWLAVIWLVFTNH